MSLDGPIKVQAKQIESWNLSMKIDLLLVYIFSLEYTFGVIMIFSFTYLNSGFFWCMTCADTSKKQNDHQKKLGQLLKCDCQPLIPYLYYSCSSTIITLILAPNHSFSCNETLDSPWCCDPIFVPTQLKFSTSPLV